MGNCISIGHKHPIGLIPDSLYTLAISCWSLTRSFPYFFCISCNFGCREDMALVECNCFNVTGNVSSLMIITSTIIATPKLWKNTLDSMIRKFSIGCKRTMFQTSTSPTVIETTIKAKTTPINIQFLLLILGSAPFVSLALPVVIGHRQWICSTIWFPVQHL